MKNILVMQTFRHGDVLQSTPAIAAVRRKHPDARVHVLVRRAFSDVLRGNPCVDEVIEWDLDAFGKKETSEAEHLQEALERLRSFVSPLREKHFDAIYNLSNDMPSAMLSYLLRVTDVSGLVFCRDRQYRVRNEWLRYLFLSSEVRCLNSINLVDIFAEACGGASDETPTFSLQPAEEEWAQSVLREKFGPDNSAPICLQIGSDRDSKRWPTGQFIELANRLMTQGHNLLIFGPPLEREEVESVRRSLTTGMKGKAVTLAGETDFGRLAALLKRCQLLVSNDSAAIHVAAAVKTPCLVLAFGATNGWETAPYGEGHFMLEPANACFPCDWPAACRTTQCRDQLTTDTVQAAIECAASGGQVVPAALQRACVTLHRSERMPDGLIGLRPITRPVLGMRDLLRVMMRTYYLNKVLRNASQSGSPRWQPWLVEFFEWYAIADRGDLLRRTMSAANEFENLRKLAQLGVQAATVLLNYCNSASDEGRARLAQSVAAIEERVLASEESDVVRFPVTGFRHSLRDMEDLGPRELAMSYRWNFQRLTDGCLFMQTALREFAQAATARASADSGPMTQDNFSSANQNDN